MKILSNHQPGFSRRTAAKLSVAGVTGLALGTAHLRRAVPSLAQESSPAASEPQVIVGDVIDFELAANGRWPGHFGSVTLALHPGYYDGGDAWFIRTDASDNDFAQANGLVYVPLLKNALDAEGSYGNIYLFDGGVDEQRPVVSTVPGQTTFTPAFLVHNVSFTGDTALMASEDAILEGAEAGTVDVEATEIIVNYPLVLWPDGGLAVDPDLVNPLGPGVLVEEPDLENGQVTFKLHQCYPGSRYIATDTSLEPMSQPMGVATSEATQALIEANATAPIYVFMPGLPGPAAMGGQPSVFNSTAGDGIWSPFWEHKTIAWNDGVEPIVLTSEAEVLEHEATGDITVFMGVPETDPVSFVVNCPAPVLAVNDYDPADFATAATPEA